MIADGKEGLKKKNPGIIFMNLVTASIVEASLQSSELDRKEKKDWSPLGF